MAKIVLCHYCLQPAELVGGDKIYPHRKDLYEKRFYLCTPCEAYVGCHPGTENPLGRLADAPLREAKREAHQAFDLIWKEGHMKRGEAYAWLAEQLGIESPHIGEMSIPLCQRVREVSLKYLTKAHMRG